jgi:PKD repeat protein
MGRGFLAMVAVVGFLFAVGCAPDFDEMPPTGQPLVSISADKTSGEAPLSVSFMVTAIPARGSIRKLVIDYGDGKSENITKKLKEYVVSVSHTYNAIGTFKVRAIALDQNDSSDAQISITTNDKPIISNFKAYTDSTYTEEATEFMPNSYVYISAYCTDSHGIGLIEIDWGDGTVEQSWDCADPGSHRYSKEGAYTIKMKVRDYAAQPLTNTASITVNIKYGIKPENQPPSLDIHAENTSGEAPLNVTLYVGVADVDGSVAEVKVDWGDGSAESLETADQMGKRDGRVIYKKNHTYSTAGGFTLTVIAKDDKDDISTETESINVTSVKPVLSVTFKDHTGADPKDKTYLIDMNKSYPPQATIFADLFAYDLGSYSIVPVEQVNYADGSTKIDIDVDYQWKLYVNHKYMEIEFDPGSIDRSPKGSYSGGITATYKITIYAVKVGVVGSSVTCESDTSPNWAEQCEAIINKLTEEPSSGTTFIVKPKT